MRERWQVARPGEVFLAWFVSGHLPDALALLPRSPV